MLNKDCLEGLKLINKISKELEIKSYVWGGLTLDIWSGEFIREHSDIDVLTENLHENEEYFDKAFSQEGFDTKHLINDDFKAVKGDVRIHFGHINIFEKSEIEWTHNGDKESLILPIDWLDSDGYEFYDLEVYTTRPEFEYVLKMHPEFLNPDWKPRAKDLLARVELEKILGDKYTDLKVLKNNVRAV